MNKASIYKHLFDLLANGKDGVEDADTILKHMMNYFDANHLQGFLEHIEDELEIGDTIEDDENDENDD